MVYPATFDTFGRKTNMEGVIEGTETDIVYASDMNEIQAAVESVERHLGLGSGQPVAGSILKGLVGGTSAWAPLDPADLATAAGGELVRWGYDDSPVFNVLKDGTIDPFGSADVTVAAQAIYDEAGQWVGANEASATVHWPVGIYPITSIHVPRGVRTTTAGIGRTRFLRTSSSPAGYGVFDARGVLGVAIPLSADAVEGADGVQIDSIAGLVAGSWVALDSNRVISTTVTPDHELRRIRVISGSGPYFINFFGTLSRGYLVTDVSTITPLTPTRVEFFDIDIDASGSASNLGIYLQYNIGSHVERVAGRQMERTLVTLDQCHGCRVTDIEAQDASNTDVGHGTVVILTRGSAQCLVERVRDSGCRTAVLLASGACDNTILDCTSLRSVGDAYVLNGSECNRNTFARCTAVASGGAGFIAGNPSFTGDLNNQWVDCSVRDATGVGMLVQNGSAGQRIVNPYILRPKATAISFVDTAHGQVLGGNLDGAQAPVVAVAVNFVNSVYGLVWGTRIVNIGANALGFRGGSHHGSAWYVARACAGQACVVIDSDDCAVGGLWSDPVGTQVGLAVSGTAQRTMLLPGSRVLGFDRAVAGFNTQDATTVVGCDFSGTTGAPPFVTLPGVANVVERNRGYNPVGPSAITVTASPFTYTAGASPERVYLYGGTVSNISRGAVQVANGTGVGIDLGPNQALTVTYSVVPTMVKDVR